MYEKLIFCARVLHKNKSEVIREAITESCNILIMSELK